MRDADNVRQVEALTPDMMGFICWEGSRRHVSRLPDYLPETCRRVYFCPFQTANSAL